MEYIVAAKVADKILNGGYGFAIDGTVTVVDGYQGTCSWS